MTAKIEQAARLKKARAEAGFASARSAAIHFGWNVSTYSAHEGGANGLSASTARQYGVSFGVSAAWLLTGERDQTENIGVIPLVGNVGAGGQISAPTEEYKPGRFTEVRLVVSIPGAKWAYRVDGREHYPRYDDGTLLIARELEPDPTPYLGKECVVYTVDGRAFVRVIREGSEAGLYDLEHFREETIRNVDVRSVGKICAAIPADEWTRYEREGTARNLLDLPPLPKLNLLSSLALMTA